MADEADMADRFITLTEDSGIEAARLKLRTRELAPMGACHYCSALVKSNQLYCDIECAESDALEKKRLREIGR
jgi:hypothetical protein